jgi:hypothetical protein
MPWEELKCCLQFLKVAHYNSTTFLMSFSLSLSLITEGNSAHGLKVYD